MSQIQSGGLIANLSVLLGATEPALRLLLTIIAGYPLAFIHRKYIYGKPPTVQHLFCFLTGTLLGFWNYGWEICHPILAIVLSYLILLILGGTALSVALIFTFNLIYLLTGYHYAGTDTYDINWTMPQCILVLRLIGTAFDYYDGQQPPEKLSKENRKVALEQCPSLLEFLAHSMFPSSFLVGPQFPMKRYQDFVAGHFGDKEAPPDSLRAGGARFALGVAYLSIFQILGLFVTDDFIMSEDYANMGFFKRMFLMGLWGRYTLYKYISCWLLTEGACILFGVTYNGKDDSGVPQWNGLENVKLSLFENTTEFTHYIQSFNINTNHWVAQYIYKRLKFLGNRHISQLCALLFLAIWHGFHSGYYVCFFFEFLVVHMEREIKSIVKNNEKLSVFFGNPPVVMALHLVLRVYTFVFMGWCLMPFALLQFDKYWRAFSAANHVGSLLFVLWVPVYSPLLKMVFKSPSKRDSKDVSNKGD